MNAGMIGLGNLGLAITERLIACGHSLSVYNRTGARAEKLVADCVASPEELAVKQDILLLCLYDSDAVQSVFDQKSGLLCADLKGKIIVDFSTNSADKVAGFYSLCHDRGARYLEAPVFGSVVPARQGTLTLVAGGDRSAYDSVLPLLEDLATTLFFLETPGHATEMKLVNNMVLAGIMTSVSDGLATGEALGIDRGDVLDILSAGAGQSVILSAKREKLETGDFSPHFTSQLLLKDLNCMSKLAVNRNISLSTIELTRSLYRKAVDSGMGNEDFSAVYKLLKSSAKK